MTDQLDQLSDAQLDEVFAVEVAKLTNIRDSTRWEMTDPPDDPIVRIGYDEAMNKFVVKAYSTDANAVLPWLEKHRYITTATFIPSGNYWQVGVGGDDGKNKSFARAACLALIRAQRATK